MSWWTDLSDDIFTPELGTALGTAWAQNYNQRGVDKANAAIKQYQQDLMNGYLEKHKAAAAEALKNQANAGDYVGITPQQGVLNAKKRWWQAQNDAQYLLNNGYGEDSDEVKKYRNEQAAAHSMADAFRKIGQGKQIDMANVGADVSSLASAKAAGDAEASPAYTFGDFQMAKDALSMSRGKPPTKEEIAQAALHVQPFDYAPTQAEVQGVYQQGNARPEDVTQKPENPYSFSVQEVRDAAKKAYSDNPDTITMQDIYNVYNNGADYNTLLNATAQQMAMQDMAQEKASPDYRDNLRNSLLKQGLPRNQVDEALAGMDRQEAAQRKQMADAALVASLKDNPQSAALINAMLANGATPSDIINAFDKSSSDYTMYETDTGDKKYVSYYDRKGRGAGSTQAFNVGINPRDKMNANVNMRGQNLSLQRAAMDNDTKMKVADMNGRYGLKKTELAAAARNSQKSSDNERKQAAYDQYIQQLLNGNMDFNTFKEKVIGISGHDDKDNQWEDNELKMGYNFLREYERNPDGENTKKYWDAIRPNTGNDEILKRIDPSIINDMIDRYGNY